MEATDSFQWSDAWLLLSLIYGRELSDRDRLRSIGDFINHAIFTDEELEGGLTRLLKAGHAVVRDEQFGVSQSVLSWYFAATAGKSRTAVDKDLRRVEAYLGVCVDP